MKLFVLTYSLMLLLVADQVLDRRLVIEPRLQSFNKKRTSSAQLVKKPFRQTDHKYSALAYCIPQYSEGCAYEEGIASFQVNTTVLSSNSGCSPGNYSSFTTVTPSVSPGVNYTITVGFLSVFYPEGVSLWADLNRNNSFETSERLIAVDNAVESLIHNLILPATTAPGPLNIRLALNFSEAPENACGTYDFGEAEDYILQVVSSNCLMYTLKNGNWNDPTVWSCNRLPTATDALQIRHAVNIPASYQAFASKITYTSGSKINFETNAKISMVN